MELVGDAVREELLRQLESRYGGRGVRGRAGLRILLWEYTVKGGYFFKRLADVAGSLFFLVAMAPLFLFTAFAIYVEDRGPIFFVQKRVGKDGRVFDMYKFRSMSVDADAVRDRLQHLNESRDGVLFKIANDPRVTRVGRILRRLSIDETPQFFNVLRGEMSLVGPRPLPVRDVAKFTLAERRRLHVKPGLTCIWQVSGRSDIPFKQQVELDLQYIRSQSLWTDVRLLFRTVLAVVIGRGAY